jgi:hypothetical protein
MTENYPITPPPELVQEWLEELNTSAPQDVLLAVVQWGADQELEASCEWLGASDRIFDFSDITTLGSGYRAYFHSDIAELLRAARRPRPPSLKEQALEAFEAIKLEDDSVRINLKYSDWEIIRRALEALPND